MTRQDLIKLATRFHTKRRLGQNFLVDPVALEKIASALEVQPGDEVLEIGPGIGFLTRFLTATGANITAVELDEDCVEILQQLSLANLKVSHGDFLRHDFSTTRSGLKVIGNVPYQITTPILVYLFGEIGTPRPWFPLIDRLVMTVQYEVAQRFVGAPGTSEYSQITLLTKYFSEAEMLFKVPSDSFYPAPKVNSAVVLFKPRKEPPIECSNHKLLRQTIKAGFSQRRKMLKNNLAFLKLDQATLDKIFKELNFDPQTRAENLSLEQFSNLTNALDLALKK